jgi:hypothetical protein
LRRGPARVARTAKHLPGGGGGHHPNRMSTVIRNG